MRVWNMLPIIACVHKSSPSPAYALAQKLNMIFENLLKSDHSPFSTRPSVRPVLLLVDREEELWESIRHAWSYQAVIHDLFSMRNNQVQLAPSGNKSSKFWDFDPNEEFWSQNCSVEIPQVAIAVDNMVKDYELKMKEMEGKVDDQLKDKMKVIPLIQQTKRSVDLHTDVATACVNEIKERKIDGFVHVESTLLNSSKPPISQVKEFLQNSGNPSDKMRLLLCLYLKFDESISKENLDDMISILPQIQQKETRSAITFINSFKSVHAMSQKSSSSSQQQKATSQFIKGMWKEVKNYFPLQKNNSLCQLLDRVIDGDMEQITTFSPGADRTSVSINSRVTFVFVLGGGNFAESQALQEVGNRKSRTIMYGATDFVSPSDFVQELVALGSE
eukprot:GHVP01031326.1.p1 GENE.GHVP01031326.1~~GHVP01031326.1.p1  ORF type:complete len:389 (+),score=71.36 GHVP01031326.1:667-1833(+)